MIDFNNTNNKYQYGFEIIKQNDKNIINNLLELEKIGYEISLTSVKPKLGNKYSVNIHEIDETTMSYLNKESEIIVLFNVTARKDDNTVFFNIERNVLDQQNKRSNKDYVFFEGSIDDSNSNVVKHFNLLNTDIRNLFKAVHSEEVINSILSEKLNDFYKIRENELTKLENLAKDLLNKNIEYNRDKEKEIEEYKNNLKVELNKHKKEVDEEYETKALSLKKKEKDLEEKQKHIDDRSSKHARREIRKELKEKFDLRSKNFSLTDGTVNKRKVIHSFSIILLILFGAGFLFLTGFSIYDIINGKNENLLVMSIKTIAFAIGFGSTSVFYIRWNNKWFEQHANEEFKIKRYEIDLERASWLVEMALEWKSECEGDIPIQLLEKLSNNMFEDNQDAQSNLHPSDQIASMLFGAASNVSIKSPTGTEVILDRKSINKIKKD